MGWKSALAYPFAKAIRARVMAAAANPHAAQAKVLARLLAEGRKTSFGESHKLASAQTHRDFAARVPLRDYEALKPYFDRVVAGEPDVLWPGRPRYFAKTSGTTSGAKYIPITSASLPNHFGTARNALFNYYAQTGHGDWLDGKLIFLSGSPALTHTNGIPTGRLSGISNHLIPAWLKRSQLPSYRVNCIEDWETKLDAIIQETVGRDLRLISGIPPWVQMYFERLLQHTGKSCVKDVFPNFSMFVYGGVNYEPYRAQLENLIGGRVASVETYPASEGFIAFQDRGPGEGLLLNVDSGIFFEFVPLDQFGKSGAERLTLQEVERDVDYAIVLSSNAGLWAYSLGDTVRFVSLSPYRVIVSGRVKHFISAFGEHVIGAEVEASMQLALRQNGGRITEFHVAPQVNPSQGELPHHEWLVDFAVAPVDVKAFAKTLDEALQEKNIYYRDLREGSVLGQAKVTPTSPGAFRRYMESVGRLGGQNKAPRLANDREVADRLAVND